MSALAPTVPIQIQNDSGAIIPPRSIVVCTSFEIRLSGPGQEYFGVSHVVQYNNQPGNIYVTGPAPIAVGKLGIAYDDRLIYASMDVAPATPIVGEQWGPVAGAWTITRGGMGFFCQGYPASNGSPSLGMFHRDRGWAWGKLTGSLAAGSAASPTVAIIDTWNPDPTSMATPPPLIVSTVSGLLGISVPNYDPSSVGSTGYYVKFSRDASGYNLDWVGCNT